MKNLLLVFAITFSSILTAQEPIQVTNNDQPAHAGYVVVVTADRNLPKVQEQYDIFENGRKFFAERNIQPYLVTPESVQSFFKENNDRLMKFGDYKKLQQADTDFLVIVLDKKYNTKYRSENPITPLEIAEVMK